MIYSVRIIFELNFLLCTSMYIPGIIVVTINMCTCSLYTELYSSKSVAMLYYTLSMLIYNYFYGRTSVGQFIVPSTELKICLLFVCLTIVLNELVMLYGYLYISTTLQIV